MSMWQKKWLSRKPGHHHRGGDIGLSSDALKRGQRKGASHRGKTVQMFGHMKVCDWDTERFPYVIWVSCSALSTLCLHIFLLIYSHSLQLEGKGKRLLKTQIHKIPTQNFTVTRESFQVFFHCGSIPEICVWTGSSWLVILIILRRFSATLS